MAHDTGRHGRFIIGDWLDTFHHRRELAARGLDTAMSNRCSGCGGTIQREVAECVDGKDYHPACLRRHKRQLRRMRQAERIAQAPKPPAPSSTMTYHIVTIKGRRIGGEYQNAGAALEAGHAIGIRGLWWVEAILGR